MHVCGGSLSFGGIALGEILEPDLQELDHGDDPKSHVEDLLVAEGLLFHSPTNLIVISDAKP